MPFDECWLHVDPKCVLGLVVLYVLYADAFTNRTKFTVTPDVWYRAGAALVMMSRDTFPPCGMRIWQAVHRVTTLPPC